MGLQAGSCCSTVLLFLRSPSAWPDPDFGAVQTSSLTRQIDILCQPRDGAAQDAWQTAQRWAGWEQQEAASWGTGHRQSLHPDRCPEWKVLPLCLPTGHSSLRQGNAEEDSRGPLEPHFAQRDAVWKEGCSRRVSSWLSGEHWGSLEGVGSELGAEVPTPCKPAVGNTKVAP